MNRLAAEYRLIVVGLRAILRFQPAAFLCFAGGVGPFLRSFLAALIVSPLQVLVVWAEMSSDKITDPQRYILYQAIAYLLGWLAYPLLLLPICRHFDRARRYTTYVSAFNWFQLIEYGVTVPVILLGLIHWLPPELTLILWSVTVLTLMVYEWFLVRRGLELEAGTTAALVIINFLLNMVISRGAEVLA